MYMEAWESISGLFCLCREFSTSITVIHPLFVYDIVCYIIIVKLYLCVWGGVGGVGVEGGLGIYIIRFVCVQNTRLYLTYRKLMR